MAQWDEDTQDWVEPPRPAGRQPDGRSRRMLIVTAAVLVLVAGAVVGLYELAGDDGPDTSQWGIPSVVPSPGWSSTPSAPWSSPGSGDLGTTADPCSAIDTSTAASLGLSSGSAANPGNSQTGMRACSWSGAGSTAGTSITYTLIYSRDIPMSPEPTPTSISGLSSASVAGNAQGCVIVWPATFGKVFVHARPSSGTEASLCTAAANFASLVAPRVPS
ncbi:DUF3558 family protein [Streptomyces sp. A1-5]|uniref:DUF3558 family protein n=2 Tax=Streptomyces TaxID=1883 RepID=UPI001963EF5E|nr:DUF3558 family protein [Streptomyces noursei]QRX90068.1 DUF3558 family protein [Streptomyces noursei]UJB40001.1 DUF3558 family protein [Streptomyces sp. A1-5]